MGPSTSCFERLGNRAHDILPDGSIVGIVPATSSATQTNAVPPAQAQVVLNWFDELKRLVPVN